MNIQQSIRYAVLAAFLYVPALSGAAMTVVNEVEGIPGANEGIAKAQSVTLGNEGVSIQGVLGTLRGTRSVGAVFDVDWYSFHALKDTVLTFDIDGGIKQLPPAAGSVNTYIAVFEPAVDVQDATGRTVPFYRRAIDNDDVPTFETLDSGSISNFDSRIDNFNISKTGIWTIGVATWRAKPLKDGDGSPTNTSIAAEPNGSYILNIEVISLPVTEIAINIEIKPGSGESAPVNHKARGVIPVAVLSSDKFDALTIKRDSLTFGLVGDEKSYLRCGAGGTDVNADGLLDLICHFDNQTALEKWEDATRNATLKGETRDGAKFKGLGSIKRKD
jgi:hypothetical protein